MKIKQRIAETQQQNASIDAGSQDGGEKSVDEADMNKTGEMSKLSGSKQDVGVKSKATDLAADKS